MILKASSVPFELKDGTLEEIEFCTRNVVNKLSKIQADVRTRIEKAKAALIQLKNMDS
jgi:hypothetical protein